MSISTLVFGQSFFNRYYGDEVFPESGRSLAMGGTNMITDYSSSLSLNNPAGLSSGESGFSANLLYHGSSILERRGFPMQDIFGDFLEYGDYVANRNFHGDLNGGFIYRTGSDSIRYAFGLNKGEFVSFDYQYEEEVRGSERFDDGILGIRDPILGYHIYDVGGNFYLVSYGASIGWYFGRESLSFGFGYHSVSGCNLMESWSVEELNDIDGYLSDIPSFDWITQIDDGDFHSMSVEFGYYNFKIAVAADSRLNMEKSWDDLEVIPDELDDLFMNLVPSPFVRPERRRLGINYNVLTGTPMNLAFQVEEIEATEYYEKVMEWKFGFEYIALGEFPVRAGYIFRETPSVDSGPESIFTFGTGKTFHRLALDVAGTYMVNSYQYPDLFEVEGDIRPDYDTVNESRFNFTASIQYQF